MSVRRFGLVLAAGLLVLALWVAFRPGKTTENPDRKLPPVGTNNPATMGLPVGGTAPVPIASTGAQATALPTAVMSTPALSSVITPGVAVPVPDAANSIVTEEEKRTATRNARIDADKVKLMFVQFRTLMGENPVGTNAEIMHSVMGGNQRQATLGPPDGMSVNGNGELTDQWGAAYFFHQLSKDVMEIRSAGPDRRMYTEDDVLLK